jgi:hypothetical protein
MVCWMPVLLPMFDCGHFPSDGEGAQLSWLRRMKIAIGIAQGLKYLHTELQPPFAISELNSNSVYVTEDFTPKVSCATDSAAPDCIHFCPSETKQALFIICLSLPGLHSLVQLLMTAQLSVLQK